MRKFLNFVSNLIGKYPALLAGALNIAILLLAKFGLHVTPDQLAAIVSAVTAILAAYVHQNVSPSKTSSG